MEKTQNILTGNTFFLIRKDRQVICENIYTLIQLFTQCIKKDQQKKLARFSLAKLTPLMGYT